MRLKETWSKYSHIHQRWLIFILLGVIIFLVSFKVKSQSEIKDIINTSLALASMILALVAIVQASISGSEIMDLFSQVRLSISEIKDPAANILEAARTLSEKSSELSVSTQNISQRLDKINSVQSIDPKSEDLFPEVTYVTMGGSLALHICKLSVELQKAFKVDDILDKQDILGGKYVAGYVTGFISGLKTSGAMSIDATNDSFQVRDLRSLKLLANAAAVGLEGNAAICRSAIDDYFMRKPA